MVKTTNKLASEAHYRGRAQADVMSAGFKGDGDASSIASKGTKHKSSSSNYKMSPLWYVVKKFNSLWKGLSDSDQNTETKRQCLQLAVGLCKKHYPDSLRFWLDLKDQAKILLDSVRFNKTCNDWGLNPQNVAEHIVIEGKSKMNNVLKDGLESFGDKARMFKDPLFVDTYNLYVENGHES